MKNVALLLLLSCIYFPFEKCYSYPLDFEMIYFPEGKPDKGKSDTDIGSILSKDQLDVLNRLLVALKANPRIGARIDGFSDINECRISDCMELSFDRASLVYIWLKKNGLSSAQLKGPVGLATRYPLYNGKTEGEKKFNRRVGFEPFVISDNEVKPGLSQAR